MGLDDENLKYIGSNLSDCEDACNARGCHVIVWHISDEHCHVLSGSVSHVDYVATLTASSHYTTCVLVPEQVERS